MTLISKIPSSEPLLIQTQLCNKFPSDGGSSATLLRLMSILALPCHGLGKPYAVGNLQRIFGGCKLSSIEVAQLATHLEDFHGAFVDSRGQLGG